MSELGISSIQGAVKCSSPCPSFRCNLVHTVMCCAVLFFSRRSLEGDHHDWREHRAHPIRFDAARDGFPCGRHWPRKNVGAISERSGLSRGASSSPCWLTARHAVPAIYSVPAYADAGDELRNRYHRRCGLPAQYSRLGNCFRHLPDAYKTAVGGVLSGAAEINPNADLCSSCKSARRICRLHANVRGHEPGYCSQQTRADHRQSLFVRRYTGGIPLSAIGTAFRKSGNPASARWCRSGSLTAWPTVLCTRKYCFSKPKSRK